MHPASVFILRLTAVRVVHVPLDLHRTDRRLEKELASSILMSTVAHAILKMLHLLSYDPESLGSPWSIRLSKRILQPMSR